jgi:hypothetical protein
MIVGELAATGTNFAPGILDTIGIATGQTKASDLRRVRPGSPSSNTFGQWMRFNAYGLILSVCSLTG